MAQSKRTAASYVAESLNTTVNPFEGLTKQQMKDKYDQEIRESGKSAKELKKIANQMQSALKRSVKNSTTKQQKTTTKQQKTTTTPTKQQKTTTTTTPSNTRRQRQPGSTGGRGKAPSGTYGKSLPSNPKLKSQPKAKTKSKLRRGSGLGGRKKPTMFNLTAMLRELGGVDPKTGRKKK